MAITVPTYDEFAVAPRSPSTPARSSVASSALFHIAQPTPVAGAGENLDAIGKGLMSAGGDAIKIANNMQDRENADMLFRAETALKNDLVQYQVQASQRLGSNAKGVTADTEKWFGETMGKHAQGLTGETQRRLFAQEAQKLRLSTIDSVSRHEAQQSRIALEDSANASIVGSINLAAANANDWSVADAQKMEIRKRIDVIAQTNGKGAEWRDQKVGESFTQLHTQVIQQLVKNGGPAALDYYKKYEQEIDGSKRAELGEYVKKAVATSAGEGAADATWKDMGPKNSTDPVKLSDMEERVRTQLKGNDDAIEKGIKGLRERASAYKDQRKEEGNAIEASVNGLILKGATTNQVRNSPEFIKLSSQDTEGARKILKFMGEDDYHKVARAAAAESLAFTREQRAEHRLNRQGVDTALAMANPTELVKYSYNEIKNLTSVIGIDNTKALLHKWEVYSKQPEKLKEAAIDKQTFDTVADSMGLKPFDPHKGEDDRRMLVTVQNRVEALIDQEQRARGNKTLSREEKEKIMRTEFARDMVKVPNWLPDVFGGRSVLPIMVPEKELESVMVPPAEMAKIKKTLEDNKLPSGSKDIARMYLRGKGAAWVAK